MPFEQQKQLAAMLLDMLMPSVWKLAIQFLAVQHRAEDHTLAFKVLLWWFPLCALMHIQVYFVFKLLNKIAAGAFSCENWENTLEQMCYFELQTFYKFIFLIIVNISFMLGRFTL